MSLASVVFAGVLDGMDGRIARMLKGQSRFGAELDSLSDVIAFGVSPAIIIHLWALQYWPRFGWLFALAYAFAWDLSQYALHRLQHGLGGYLTLQSPVRPWRPCSGISKWLMMRRARSVSLSLVA